MVDVSDAGFGQTPTNAGKEFKEILKKQKAPNFRLCRTPSYDVTGTVKASLQDGTSSKVSALSLMFVFDGPGVVDAAVVDTLGSWRIGTQGYGTNEHTFT